jgi:uncharacterized protein (TIGR02099 family)
MIKRLTRLTGWLLLLLLVAAALLTLAGRWLLPSISQHRAVVEGLLTSQLGAPVSLAGVSGRWRGYGPEITLTDLRLHNREGGTRLRLARVTANLHLLDSLQAGQLMPRELTIDQLRILVQRKLDRSLVVAGLEGVEGSASDAGLTLLGLPFRVHVSDAQVRFEDLTGTFGPQQLDGIDLNILGDEERMQISARLSPRYGGLRVDGELKGDPTRVAGWSGELYLQGKQIDLARLFSGPLPGQVQIRQGLADTRLWSHWQSGRLKRIRGESRIQGAILARGERGFAFDELKGRYRWQRHNGDWRLDMDRLSFRRDGRRWEGLSDATLRYRGQGRQQELAIRINRAIIQDIAHIIRFMPPSDDVVEFLEEVEPRGDIAELTVLLKEQDGQPSWFLGGRIKRLATNDAGPLPALSNLGGEIAIHPNQGSLVLQESDGTIDFTNLFRDPIAFDAISGLVEWQIDEQEQITIASRDLYAANRDIETRSRFELILPADDNESAHLDLQSDFSNGDGKQVSPYLPTTIMGPATVAWLDEALVDGRVRDGVCLLRGPLDDFPFREGGKGRFEVSFFVEDGVLAFQPDWPPIEQLDAEVRFVDNRFEAIASDGRFFGHQILNARAAIGSLFPVAPLTIRGSTSGSLARGLDLLRESPLKGRFEEPLQGIEGEGWSRVDIDLAIPLGAGEFSTEGTIYLVNNRINLQPWEVDLHEVKGKLRFTEQGMQASTLHANLQGYPVRGEIGNSPTHEGYTLIHASADLPAQQLVKRYPMLEPLGLSGQGKWDLDIHLPPMDPEKGGAAHIHVASDLKGVAIDLPPPLGKLPQQALALGVELEVQDQGLTNLRLHYADRMDAAVRFAAAGDGADREIPEIAALELAIGEADLLGDAPGEGGLRLRARSGPLDLTPWLEDLSRQGAGLEFPPLSMAHLVIPELRWGEHSLDDLVLRIDNEAGSQGWQGEIRSRQISGRFRYPHHPQDGLAEIELEKLALELGAGEAGEGTDPAGVEADQQQEPKGGEEGPSLAAMDPRSLPAFDIHAEQLLINQVEVGSLEAKIVRTGEGLELTSMTLGDEQHRISGSGSWHQLGDGRQRSEFELLFESESLAELLTRLDLAKALQGAPTRIEGRLAWPDAPYRATAGTLEGALSIAIEQGSAPEMDPGLGRMFGLLNITALQRRLTLDFSDIFGEGFSFDSIEGEIGLAQGKASSDNLLIEGPAARIEISGTADLDQQTLDQQVTVSGKISSALPIAGTLTGGPAVGAALLIAQHLLGDKMDRISAAEYQITGPWDTPLVERINQPPPPTAPEEPFHGFDPLEQ